MGKFIGFERGIGIGGWLTNYKRFHVLPKEKINELTIGDMEHFQSYITEKDVENIAKMGFDHVRVCFDQIVSIRFPSTRRREPLFPRSGLRTIR